MRFPLPTTCAVIRLVYLARVSPVLLKMLIPSHQRDSSALLGEVTNSDLNGGHSLQFVSILSAFRITYNPASRQKTMIKTPSNPSTTLSPDEPPSWHEKLCLSPVLPLQLDQEREGLINIYRHYRFQRSGNSVTSTRNEIRFFSCLICL